jgi:hypothetical protein
VADKLELLVDIDDSGMTAVVFGVVSTQLLVKAEDLATNIGIGKDICSQNRHCDSLFAANVLSCIFFLVLAIGMKFRRKPKRSLPNIVIAEN